MNTIAFTLICLAALAVILMIAWHLDDKGREQAKNQWRRTFWSKERIAAYEAEETVPLNSKHDSSL